MIPDGVIRTAGFNLAHANKQAGEIERIILKEFQFSGITCTLLALICKCLIINGAGEGNRTLVIITFDESAPNCSQPVAC